MLVLQMSFIFVLGTILGSFLNVCVYRLPRRESVLWPRSYCVQCRHPIPMLYNVPVLSYLMLGGKCKFCRARIPLSYPAIEILAGLLLVLVWLHYGPTKSFLHYSILMLLLLPISFIDLNHKLVLNVLTFPGMAIGLMLNLLTNQTTLLQSGFGVLVGGGFLLLVGALGTWFFKQESMGGGDIKLGAMIGAFMGPKVLIVLFLAFFLAAPVIVFGLITGRLSRGSTVPFAPFISLGAAIIVCFGPTLYDFYATLLG